MSEQDTGRAIVYVVDDDPAVGQALGFLLRSFNLDCRIYRSVQKFLDAYDGTLPGCLLLDVRMPEMSGLEFLDRIEEFGVQLPVIMLTGHGDVPMAVHAMKSGAADFLQKPVNGQKLIEVVQKCVAQDAENRRFLTRRHDVAQRLATLSEREREVMQRVANGQTSKAIAHELGLSTRTVESHRASAMRKLRVRRTYDVIRLMRSERGADPDSAAKP